MTYRLEIRPDALTDIEQAARWYEERASGLGTKFERETLETIDSLSLHPHYRIRHKRWNIRWKLLSTFPYRVVFQMKDDLVTVIAVIHSARQDRNWLRRL